MSWYSWFWVGWFTAFLVVESIAIYRNRTVGPGGKGVKDRLRTLSQNVWKLFKIRDEGGWHWRRAVLAGFMVWLLVHMVAGF